MLNLFCDVSVSPVALRMETFLPLFLIIVLLEILVVFSLLKSKIKSIFVILSANIISSLCFAPIMTEVIQWEEYPLLFPAYESYQSSLTILELIFSFIFFFFALGSISIIIEGSLLRTLLSEDKKRVWGVISFANLISYLFLFQWSVNIGNQIRGKEWVSAEAYIFNKVLYTPNNNRLDLLREFQTIFLLSSILILLSIFVLAIKDPDKSDKKDIIISTSFGTLVLFSLLIFSSAIILFIIAAFLFFFLIIGFPIWIALFLSRRPLRQKYHEHLQNYKARYGKKQPISEEV